MNTNKKLIELKRNKKINEEIINLKKELVILKIIQETKKENRPHLIRKIRNKISKLSAENQL